MKILLLSLLIIPGSFAIAQNVGIGTTAPNNTAALDVSATNKGVLIPRLTTAQRKAIANPATGLLAFDTDKGSVMFFDGTAWRALSFSDENKSDPLSRNSTQPVALAGFGTRVAISGDYAIVGAPKYKSTLSNMGAAYIFNKTSAGWKQTARLAAYDSAASDYFGGAVAISGDYAVVGCPNKTYNGNVVQGRAYIYHRSGTSWLLDTAIVNRAGAAYEDFGWSVGVCAYNTGGAGVVIGAPYYGTNDAGAVFCYKKTGTAWGLVQTIIPTDLSASDNYGITVSMDTDYVAIGATGQDNATYSYSNAGAVYVYAFGGGVWNFQQKLQGYTASAQFGLAISLSSNKLVVGAPWATSYTNTSSTVYIYERTGSTWTNIGSLFIYNFEIVPGAGQMQPVGSASAISIVDLTFGMSVSLSGNTLLIGASGGIEYPNGGSSYYSDRIGTVYVYKSLNGTNFTRMDIIQSDFPAAGDLFGQSVSISGNKYIVANSHAIVNGLQNAGNVYFGNE